MSRHACTQLALAATAGLLGFAGTSCALNHLWWEGVMFGFVTVFLVEASYRDRHAHQLAVRRAQAAERTARPQGTTTPLLAPCCPYWTASAGVIHSHTCTTQRALRDDIVLGWADLNTACCLTAWESRGTTHDTSTCTRTDAA